MNLFLYIFYRGGLLITPFMYGRVIKIQRRQSGGIMVRTNVLVNNKSNIFSGNVFKICIFSQMIPVNMNSLELPEGRSPADL